MCKESLVPSSFPHSLNLRKDLLNISSHFMRLDDQRDLNQGKNMSVRHLSPDQPTVLSRKPSLIALSWNLRQLELQGPPRNFLSNSLISKRMNQGSEVVKGPYPYLLPAHKLPAS